MISLPLWVRKNFTDAQFRAIDPRAEATCMSALFAEFEQLLRGAEEPLHQFICNDPQLLSPAYDRMWSKLPFGDSVSDFVFREASNDYLLVELEQPGHKLFRKNGAPHSELVHARAK